MQKQSFDRHGSCSGNRRTFDAEMRNWAHARSGMEADLREALGRNELRLQFQPIVEIRTGRVHAFEALLRTSPRRRPVMGHLRRLLAPSA